MSKFNGNDKKTYTKRKTEITDPMDFPEDREELKAVLKERLIFEKPEKGQIPDSVVPINFIRNKLSIQNADGSVGDLVVEFDRCYSYGVNENLNPQTKNLDGYQISLSMYDRDGPTPKQYQTVKFIEVLSEIIKEHLLTEEFKEATGQYDLEAAFLKKINPLWVKKDERGKPVPNATPSLYPKLKWYKAGVDKKGNFKPATMTTPFYMKDEYDANGDPIEEDPLKFLNTPFYVRAAVQFHSVFLNSVARNLQVKLYEAEIEPVQNGRRRLLKYAPPTDTQIIMKGENPLLKKSSMDDEDMGDEKVTESKASEEFRDVKDNSRVDRDELVMSEDEAEVQKPKEEVVKKKKVKKPVKTTKAVEDEE